MQTFLPNKSFKISAQMLDNKRLGKQRVETLQILKALTLPKYGWKNHPATKMWEGHVNELVQYGVYICQEWRTRGFKDTCLEKIQAFHQNEVEQSAPSWWGNEALHSSHRANLLRKDWVHYSRFNWTEMKENYLEAEYYWPTKN
jgi:hypothetical protein